MNATQFSASLSKWSKDLRGRLDEAVRYIDLAVAEEVIVGRVYSPGSPVDTGFFRSAWMVSIGGMPQGDLVPRPNVRGSYPASLDQITLILARVKAGPSLFLSNPADYGLELELGHSQQAPRGMVRITVAAGQLIVDDVVRQMVQ